MNQIQTMSVGMKSSGPLGREGGEPRLRFGLLVGLLCVLPGCSRAFWRQQADRDAYEAIGERISDPRWQLPRVDVVADSESRFFDPYDADKPPLPPDDPSAHEYMHCVDGIGGYKSWHNVGDSFTIENPQWLSKYGLTPEMMNPTTGDYTGRLPTLEKLSLADCVELSQIHSRELQTQIESLYLSSLSVSFQRFQFNVRYLNTKGAKPTAGINNTFLPFRSGSSTGSSNIGVSKLLPAGGQIAAELSNNTIWLFSGQHQTHSASVLSYSLIQPLLLGAGRNVAMENLTQAERNLLYQARSLSRFRQTLFTNVVSDGGGGGVTGGSASVNSTTVSGGVTTTGVSAVGGGGGGSGSFLSLLQQIQQIRNQEQNIERTRQQVAILQSNASQKNAVAHSDLVSLPEGIVFPAILGGQLEFNAQRKLLLWFGTTMAPEQKAALLSMSDNALFQTAAQELIQNIESVPATLDVLQLQNTLVGANVTLRTLERGLQDGLDSLKLSLGLPPDLVLTIDDSMLDQFMIVDPKLRSLESEVTAFIEVWGQLNEDNATAEQLLATNTQLSELLSKVEQDGLSVLDRDVTHLKARLPRRMQKLETDAERDRVRFDVERDLRLMEDARSQLARLRQDALGIEARIQALEAAPAAPPPEAPPAEAKAPDEAGKPQPEVAAEEQAAKDAVGEDLNPREVLRLDILKVQQKLLQITRSLSVVQIGLRVEQIELPDFEMPIDEVALHAVENRVDLMNQKAAVTDARRKVEIAANKMKAGLNVVVQGNVLNSNSNKPFDFQGMNSQVNAGISFTAPLDQITERNNYRAALIAYQQSRRDYMAAEDTIKQRVRGNWRQLAVLRRNLEASRLQVRLAARQFDSAVDQANAPAAVGGAGGGQGGVQGNLLVQALNSIISAQNTLISNWVSYEQNRLGIYRDMGMMEIGPDGIWNDPAYRGTSDRDTPEGLPDPQTSPSSGLNDDPQEIVPHLDSAPDLGMSRPVWSGPGGDGPAEGLVQTAHGNGEARLFRADDEGRGEEAVPDQSVSAGNAGQLGELDAD